MGRTRLYSYQSIEWWKFVRSLPLWILSIYMIYFARKLSIILEYHNLEDGFLSPISYLSEKTNIIKLEKYEIIYKKLS
jgi:hypothetical protein